MTKYCRQCGRETLDFIYDWNGRVCDRCKNRRTIKFTLIFGLIGLIISIFIVPIDYRYEINKCSDLKLTESQYDFTHVIETNAEYNSHCYYLRNHPLAIPFYYIIGGLLGIILFATIGAMIGLFTKPFREYK